MLNMSESTARDLVIDYVRYAPRAAVDAVFILIETGMNYRQVWNLIVKARETAAHR